MKKLIKYIAAGVAFVAMLAGCSNVITNVRAPASSSTEKCLVNFSVADTNSRTALPVINWTDYTFELVAIRNYKESNQEAPKTLFTGKSYAGLTESIQVALGKYKFTLNAYKSGVKILSGSMEKELNGNASLSFKMYPVSGSTGNAVVTIQLPSDDTTVSAIRAVYSTNIVKLLASAQPSEVDVLPIDANKKAVYEIDNLPSNSEQYAIIYFMNAQNEVVLSKTESLVIVGGCTSTSTINVSADEYHSYACALSLKKDGFAWRDSGISLKLVNNATSKAYELRESNGVFTSNVAEGNYDVYIDNVDSGIDFASVDKTGTVDFYTATLNSVPGVALNYVSGAFKSAEPDYYVLKGNSFVFKAIMADGYVQNGFAIKNNGVTVSTNLGSNITIPSMAEAAGITVTGVSTVSYTITYNKDENWVAGYTAPSVFTVEDTVNLPTAENLRKDGKILDGWKISGGDGTVIASIAPGSITGNVILIPVWKDSATADDNNKVIYANGINLIINSENNETHVYVDFNGNGEKDSEDYQVISKTGKKDFTNYTLRAGNEAGTPIASDFKFTMTGGSIKDIWGLENSSNKSILNIKGDAKIGSTGSSYTDPATQQKFVADVHGVHLATITDNWVTLIGQMTGDYKIHLITEDEYDPSVPHYVARIGTKTWASLDNFTCYKKTSDVYSAKSLLAMKDIEGIGNVIRLANPNAIALPDPNSTEAADRPIGDVSDTVNGFTLGSNRISTECSVFSVSVENGTFEVASTTISGGTSYLAQPTETTYEEALKTDQRYVYMQIMSETNQISSVDASEFLEGMVFRRDVSNVPVKIKINLETVPYSDIAAAGVSYFNGSFYKGVNKGSTPISWENAYAEAKSEANRFNGMKGYLGNFTSLVEYNYITERLGLGYSWCGGARLDNREGNYDNDVIVNGWDANHVTKDPTFRWQAGPEAGEMFTDGVIGGATTTLSSATATQVKSLSRLTSFANKEVLLLDSKKKIIGRGFAGGNSGSYTLDVSGIPVTGTAKYIVLATATHGKGYYYTSAYGSFAQWVDGEPNDSWSGKSEQCVHFYPKDNNEGKWNDFGHNNTDVKAYIIEYTPYETIYGSSAATDQSIRREQEY